MISKEELFEEIQAELQLLKKSRLKLEQQLRDVEIIKKKLKAYDAGMELLAKNVIRNQDELKYINKSINKKEYRKVPDDVMFG